MQDDQRWADALPAHIKDVLASYDAVDPVDVMAVLRRQKMLREAVRHLSWDEVIAAGIGIRNNSFGTEPGIAVDLMMRPEAGLLFVGGFFTELGVPGILRRADLFGVEEYRARIETIRILVNAINVGQVTETSWEFIDNGWLLARARDRLADVGPEWALDPSIVDPVIEGAARRLDARLRNISFDKTIETDSNVVDLAAHKSGRDYSAKASPKGGVERLMKSLKARKLF